MQECAVYNYQAHALIEVLHTLQESFGYLDEDALRFVAAALHIPPSRVYGVSTFYNLFSLKPQGAHTCVVCLGTACYVKGGDNVLAAIEGCARIRRGETTAVYDGIVAGHQTPEQAVEKIEGILGHGA